MTVDLKQRGHLLSTKQVADRTGLSKSFFEKGRIYGYGPKFFKLRSRVFYGVDDLEAWVANGMKNPGGINV